MLSRWRMQEQHNGARGLSQFQLVFLELPKYDVPHEPRSIIEKWAYFFREAPNLEVIPPALSHSPLAEALEAARTARFTREEWALYIEAGMAIQNERGLRSLALREGLEQGQLMQARVTLRRVLAKRVLALRAEDEARIDACTRLGTLEQWLDQAMVAAAIANAVFHATGRRVRDLPITLDKLL